MLAHNVYFKLKDASPSAKQALLGACRQYLTGHPGQVFFACGTVCEELCREVNVRDFDVALHIVFDTKDNHDLYQEAERHEHFVHQFRENWAQVRVFDTLVSAS